MQRCYFFSFYQSKIYYISLKITKDIVFLTKNEYSFEFHRFGSRPQSNIKNKYVE